MKQKTNILRAMVIAAWIILMAIMLNSCGSACSRTHRYWSNHRCV